MRNYYFLFFLSVIISFSEISCIRFSDNFETEYVKKESYITMRDGVKLYTAIYSPRDNSEKYPILLMRTPYSIAPYGEHKIDKNIGPSSLFKKEKYIFVYQDVRGRFMSEGEFVNMRPYIPNKKTKRDIDETTDTYDTIEWLINNVPNNNGKAGMWGISYPGFYAAMGCIDAHPALKAVSPQAPISDWFVGDDFHHNGAFFLSDAFHFFGVFGLPKSSLTKEWPKAWRPEDIEDNDGFKFYLGLEPLKNTDDKYFHGKIPFWNELLHHPDYDEHWKSRSTLPHLRNIKPAVLVTGGWFDAEDLYGSINTYKNMEKNNPDNKIYYCMGPWFHGGWGRSEGDSLGDISFDSKTSEYYQNNIELPFFNYYLKGKGSAPGTEANIFETGSNKWLKFSSWPPSGTEERTIYIGEGKSLNFIKPSVKGSISYSYISDPFNPVPYTSVKEYSTSHEFMVENQKFAADRSDVLTLTSSELDSNITFAGPINADLFVATSGTDADWVVKVIDVFPDNAKGKMAGYQMLLRWEIMRGKYRNSYEEPEAFKSGIATKLKFTLPDVCHTFLKGHKIMIQIQSSFFPMVDINPQTFTDIYTCDTTAFKKAKQSVFYSRDYPSSFKVNILK